MLKRHVLAPWPPRPPRPPRIRAGIGTLAFVSLLLMLTASSCFAAMHLLTVGRILASRHIDREIAMRAAEVALVDAEADVLAALAQGGGRLLHWPAAGTCAEGAGQGLCVPAHARTPAWWRWLEGHDVPEAAVVGTFTGAFTGTFASTFASPLPSALTGTALPALPAGVAGATILPRYVLEPISDGMPGQLPRFRVTALGFGRDPAVRVLLQSEFQP
ncbi:pilus assembly PilX family protein [Cupriavidus plantarum]|uniref:pilus assembly PilX family protein n=1 Tax=Cupriavidus plantarum TaxID=942865 RepID=UPI0015C86336|nr:pilus assembly protein PilX [Cupriavidus plantarum]NYH98112.1 Tfp pilus assembly protein PilX [Cupriavidus plantarum]